MGPACALTATGATKTHPMQTAINTKQAFFITETSAFFQRIWTISPSDAGNLLALKPFSTVALSYFDTLIS